MFELDDEMENLLKNLVIKNVLGCHLG